MKKGKSLQFYKKLLPQKLTVEIHRSKDGGFWAKIKNLPYCYTQAKSFLELIDMVNDAVYTHLGIPNRFRGKLGYYLPKKFLQEIQNELKRKHWENVIKKIIEKGRAKEKTQIFQLK